MQIMCFDMTMLVTLACFEILLYTILSLEKYKGDNYL